MRIWLLIPLFLLAAACGGEDVAAPAPDPTGGDSDLAAGGGTQRADNDLVLTIDAGEPGDPQTYHLTCVGFVDGDHPNAEAACEHLKSLDEPFAPIPADAICTEQYGGPQTAHVTGLWRGEPVDLKLSRVNGCYIAQWDRLGPFLPGPVGVTEPMQPGEETPQ